MDENDRRLEMMQREREKEEICPACGKVIRGPNVGWKLKRHMNSEHEKKAVHKCPACDESFVYESALRRHKGLVHGEKEKKNIHFTLNVHYLTKFFCQVQIIITLAHRIIDRLCTIDYRCADGRFLESPSFVAISNPASLPSSETGVNPGIRS
jgi:ribosomal protein L37AE/L43A